MSGEGGGDWGWLHEPEDLPGTCLTCHRTWRQCADMVIERNQDGVPGCCADCGHRPLARRDRATFEATP